MSYSGMYVHIVILPVCCSITSFYSVLVVYGGATLQCAALLFLSGVQPCHVGTEHSTTFPQYAIYTHVRRHIKYYKRTT